MSQFEFKKNDHELPLQGPIIPAEMIVFVCTVWLIPVVSVIYEIIWYGDRIQIAKSCVGVPLILHIKGHPDYWGTLLLNGLNSAITVHHGFYGIFRGLKKWL